MKTLEELTQQLADIQKEIETLKQTKPVFEVDKWYKQNNGKKMWFIRSLDRGQQMSFGFNEDGIWQPLTERHSVRSEFHVATNTEIQETLEKEAVKSGLVDGAKYTVRSYKGEVFNRVVRYPLRLNGAGNGLVDVGGNYLLDATDGQWATVQKEQPLMIGGYEVKVYPKDKFEDVCTTIDGNRFGLDFWQAAKLISEHSKAKIMVGCSKQFDVSLELINQILEKLK